MKNIFIALFLGILLSSCEKVINLELSSSSSQIVIEGSITNQTGQYTVKISKSINFDESSKNYPTVSNAVVEISDNKGNSEILLEIEAGTYKTSTIQGIPGNTYNLKVSIEGKTYSATSYMPYPINIDTITVAKGIFGNSNQYTIKFNDPADIQNFYRIIKIENNIASSDIFITNDKLHDGKLISYSMTQSNLNGNNDIQKDSVTLLLLSIDENVYEYYRTIGGGQKQESASPANPTSNINNGALGYFNAYSVTKMSIITP